MNRLTPYTKEWPELFKVESQTIRNVCGEFVIALEHVGSTSVPGLTAKPIIDMAVGVATLDNAEKIRPAMESIGYDYPGDIGIPDDRIFGRDPGFRKYLVHVVIYNSPRWHFYIKFRDALRANTRLAAEYTRIKTEIVESHPEGRAIYTDSKQILFAAF